MRMRAAPAVTGAALIACSADPHGGQCTPLSWGKLRREVQIADPARTGDDAPGGVVPLGTEPDVLHMSSRGSVTWGFVLPGPRRLADQRSIEELSRTQ